MFKNWLRTQRPENFYASKNAAFIGGICTAYVFGWMLPKYFKYMFGFTNEI